jgi:hypothetical protein
LDFGHRNLGFEPGTFDLFDPFFRSFFGLKECEAQTMAFNEKMYVNLKISKKIGNDF